MPKLFDKCVSVLQQLSAEKVGVPAVGLDIGAYACKAVKVKKTGSGYILLDWAVVSLEAGDQKKAIQAVLKKIAADSFVPLTAVSGKGTLIRYIDLPRMNLADLKKSFAFEADKYFPFPLDRIYTDCHILDANGKDNKMQVLVAAAKKEIVDGRVELLTEMGYHPDFISLNAVANANVVNVLNPEMKDSPQGTALKPDEAVAILDIGEIVSNLSILAKGLPQFTRDIFIGGRDFTKGLTNSMSLRYEEAESLKQNPGEQQPKVLEACESVIINLVSELRLSFDYFVTEKNLPVTRLLLTGGTSRLEGIDDIFEKNLDMTISRWDPFPWVGLAATVNEEDVRKHAALLSVALGLALYGP